MKTSLPNRPLGRSDKPVPPLAWSLTTQALSQSDALGGILSRCAEVGANWLIIPSALPADVLAAARPLLEQMRTHWSVVMGIDAAQLQSRAHDPLRHRLSLLGRENCEAAMIEGAAASEIKSGRPFHRLMQWRDRGLISTFFIEPDDVPEAEWMVGNTPAHAVVVPFGLLDQTAAYRVLPLAAEVGTAILAGPVVAPAWTAPEAISAGEDLSFIAAHATVAAAVRRIPTTLDELERLLAAAANPMPPAQRDKWWSRFQQAVPEPRRPRHNLPPEFA